MQTKMWDYLPPRIFIVLIVALIAVSSANYFVFFNLTPPGYSFVGHSDDVYVLTYMRAAEWNFINPWSTDETITVFHDPIPTTPYLYVPLGALGLAFGADLHLLYIAFKIIVSFIFLVVIYNVLKRLDRENYKISFTVFSLFAGIGWLLYISASVVAPASSYIVGSSLTYEFVESSGLHVFHHLERPYRMLAEVFSYIGIVAFIAGRRRLSALLVGLTALLYPHFIVPVMAVLAVYVLIGNYKNSAYKVAKSLLKGLYVHVISVAIFMLPWVVAYLQHPYFFLLYKKFVASATLLPIIVTVIFSFLLGTYFLVKNEPRLRSKIFAAPFALTFVLFVAFASFLQKATPALYTPYALYTELPFFLLLFASLYFVITSKRLDANSKFFASWVVLMLVLSTFSPAKAITHPVRILLLISLPLSILAAKGLVGLSKSLKVSHVKILAVLVVLSLPSFAAYNYYQHVQAFTAHSYIQDSDFEAVKFLSTQSPGRVMASDQTGYIIPYHANKSALLVKGMIDEEKQGAVREFYSIENQGRRMEILELYNITYVFSGSIEKSLFNVTALEGTPGLEVLYNTSTAEVYRFSGRSV